MLGVTWEEFSTYLFVKKGLDRGNVSSYRSIFARITHFFLNKPYNEVNFLKFIEYLEQEKKLSNSSINNYIKLLKHLNKYLGIDPDFAAEQHYKKKDEPFIDVLTLDEVNRLLEVMYQYDYRVGVMGEILARLGLRNNELINMRWEHIKGETLVLPDTKSGVTQTVWIPDDLLKKICKLKRYPHGYIVGTQFGKLNRERVNKYLRKAALEAHIDKYVHAHLLRHTCGTLTYNGSKDIAGTKEIMRHKDISTTMRYVHLSQDYKREVASKNPLNSECVKFDQVKLMTENFKNDLSRYNCVQVEYKQVDGKIVLVVAEV